MAIQWYVNVNGKAKGPFSSARLKKLAQAKKISALTQISQGKDGAWITASRVNGLIEKTKVSFEGMIEDVLAEGEIPEAKVEDDEGVAESVEPPRSREMEPLTLEMEPLVPEPDIIPPPKNVPSNVHPPSSTVRDVLNESK